jgi:hypothetical protein
MIDTTDVRLGRRESLSLPMIQALEMPSVMIGIAYRDALPSEIPRL